ncbi:MAG: hypothetical protein AVDCRST_MAG32-512, partial [uncultured Nocardioides sp.]
GRREHDRTTEPPGSSARGGRHESHHQHRGGRLAGHRRVRRLPARLLQRREDQLLRGQRRRAQRRGRPAQLHGGQPQGEVQGRRRPGALEV